MLKVAEIRGYSEEKKNLSTIDGWIDPGWCLHKADQRQVRFLARGRGIRGYSEEKKNPSTDRWMNRSRLVYVKPTKKGTQRKRRI